MQPLNFNLNKANYHRPLLFNSVLWSLAFVILLFVFSKGESPIRVDYLYTITFLLVLAIPVSLNFYLLIPKLLTKEYYLFYLSCFLVNLFLFAALTSWLLQPLLDSLFPDYFFISYLSRNNIFLVFIIVLIASTLLKLAEDWFYFNTNENKILKQKNQQIETQLSALRAQINPHFLFNSLNVIYAMALEKKKDITSAIVQLSDILRYVIYDSDTERVLLKEEIQLLKNYIAFQDHRLETPHATHFEIHIADEDFKIYPMLLLPLLENSYKHGIVSGKTKRPIVIDMHQKENKFEFTISNANLETKNQLEDKYSGVGLQNLETNLNLVYPDKHQFKIESTTELFKVTLIIENDV